MKIPKTKRCCKCKELLSICCFSLSTIKNRLRHFCDSCCSEMSAKGRATKKKNKARQGELLGNSYKARDVILEELGFGTYAKYLQSPLWSTVKGKVFSEKGSKCLLCGNDAFTVHHNRYSKKELLGLKLKEMSPICEACHHTIEFNRDGTKRALFQVRGEFKRLRKEFMAGGKLTCRVGVTNGMKYKPGEGIRLDNEFREIVR